MNISTTEAELFAIKYGISQVFQIHNVIYIVITNIIYATRHIFNTFIYLY